MDENEVRLIKEVIANNFFPNDTGQCNYKSFLGNQPLFSGFKVKLL